MKEIRMSRREFLKAVSIGAAGIAVLAACAPKEEAAEPTAEPKEEATAVPPAAEPVKITIWDWYTETEAELKKACDGYVNDVPNVTVEQRTYGGSEYLQVLEAAIAGGTGPDVFGPHVHAVEYGLAGQTIDLNSALDATFLEKFFPSTRKQFTAEGKQFALGWMAQTFGFFQNPALFEQAGVTEVPETWDDIIAVSEKFKAANIIPWVFNNADKWMGCDYFLPLITQATDDPDLVYLLDEHTKDGVSWDSQPVIDACGMFDKLVKAEVFQEGVNGTNWDQAVAMFYGGKAAMWFAGSWVPAGIVADAPPEIASSYKVFKTPAWAKGKPHWCGNQAGAAYAIYAKGHTKESIDFVNWLYEDNRYVTIMNNSFSMPSTSQAAAMISDPIMKEMTSWLPDGAPHILFGKGSWDAVSNNVQSITGQTATPEEVAAQIEADVVASRKL